MSSSLLATIAIVLSEVVIILLILSVFLLSRLRKLKSTAKTIQPPAPAVTQSIETGPSLKTYIEDQITRTTQKLEDIASTDDHSQKSALASRLGLLKTEKQVLDTVNMDTEHQSFWKVIEQYYQEEAVSIVDGNNNNDTDAALITRLKKLEIFKDLFFNAQNKLKDSFDIINGLKHTISGMHTDEENLQIEDMVDKLSIDNISLHKQLDKANQHLKSILDDAMQSVSDNGNIPINTDSNPDNADEEINELRDENEFLVSQIQSLLQQELAHTKSLQDRIDELETSQHESESAREKFNDLQEENEFLTTQIQFLLQQEIQQTKNLQDRIAELEASQNENESASKQFNDLKEENEFLSTQIEFLLHQELESSNVNHDRIVELEAKLKKEQEKSVAFDNKPVNDSKNTEKNQQTVKDNNSDTIAVATEDLEDIAEDLELSGKQETNTDSRNS